MTASHQSSVQKTTFPFLPFFYKKAGALLFLLVVLTAILHLATENKTISNSDANWKLLLKGTLIISVLLVVFSKEKVEDPNIKCRRKRAFAGALVVPPLSTAIGYFMGEHIPVNELIWSIVLFSAIWYFMYFYFFDYPWITVQKKKQVHL